MTMETMTSLQRVLTTLSHNEPDRVPFFLLLTTHGAKEMGMSIQDYFSSGENVAEGQLQMRKKFRHDCLYSFFYAPVEVEACGGQVIYVDDGPPNSGEPFIRSFSDIEKFVFPDIQNSACLQKVLQATRLLKQQAKDEVPIIGVVMSPFSLPIMQMGFSHYLDLIYTDPELFERLMAKNEDFCANWANAQLEAGATAICFFDPVASTTIVTREMYLQTGYKVACRTLARIKGPTATHLASGNGLTIFGDLATTGTAAVGVSALEDLQKTKEACRGKLTVIGNLNGIEMCRWSQDQAETAVKVAIDKAAAGGGFILSDNHGEIPWQVSEDTLLAISQAVIKFGRYPLI